MGWEKISLKLDNLKNYGLSQTVIDKIPQSYITNGFVSAAGLEHVGAIKSNSAILSFIDNKSQGEYSAVKHLAAKSGTFWGTKTTQDKKLSPYSHLAENQTAGGTQSKSATNPFAAGSQSFFRDENNRLKYLG